MKIGIRLLIVLAIVGYVAFNGFYTINSGEEAIITQFGKYARTETQAGLRWKIPVIEEKYVVDVAQVRRMEFGFSTESAGGDGRAASYKDIGEDSLMLTADENLVNVEAIIQYKIADSRSFLFNVEDQDGTLRVVSVSTIRRSVANNSLDDVLTDNKLSVQTEILMDLQSICDIYGLGIQITAVQLQDVYPPTEVDDAFKDIARAKLDKESKINEAQSYENKVIPDAKGESSKLISQAEGYNQDRINRALGDVANFNQVYDKYKDAKQVTRVRMYLETMASILPGIQVFITQEDGNTLKFLPLQETLKGAQ
jgi:membrane protease subunit HflK